MSSFSSYVTRLAILFTLPLLSCAWHLPGDKLGPAERLHPTPEQIAALLRTSAQPPPARQDLHFLHPKRLFVLASPSSVDLPVQIWVPRHADNRAYLIAWSGASCAGGSNGKTLDGEHDASPQPTNWTDLKVRIAGVGLCAIVASVFGPGARVRQTVTLAITAGSEDGGLR